MITNKNKKASLLLEYIKYWQVDIIKAYVHIFVNATKTYENSVLEASKRKFPEVLH